MMRTVLVVAAAALVVSAPALAHPGHGHEAGFAAGLLHPLGGLDHLAAMLAVGLWAGLAGETRRWVWPAAFLAGMAVGGALGWWSVLPAGIGLLIGVTLLALGAALLARWSPAVALGAAAIAAAGGRARPGAWGGDAGRGVRHRLRRGASRRDGRAARARRGCRLAGQRLGSRAAPRGPCLCRRGPRGRGRCGGGLRRRQPAGSKPLATMPRGAVSG